MAASISSHTRSSSTGEPRCGETRTSGSGSGPRRRVGMKADTAPRSDSTPTLHNLLKALPWAEMPVGDRHRDHGHGRRETRTVKALTDRTPGGLGFPHAEQAVRITRTRTIKGKTSRETAYLVVSLPAEHAQPEQLQDWARLEWHIENP